MINRATRFSFGQLRPGSVSLPSNDSTTNILFLSHSINDYLSPYYWSLLSGKMPEYDYEGDTGLVPAKQSVNPPEMSLNTVLLVVAVLVSGG